MGASAADGRGREAALAWLGCAAAAGGFWLWRIHLDRPEAATSFAWLDLYQYVLPAAVFVREELQAGRLPLWNPYQLAGMPTAALGMPGALYPGNLALLAWLPAARALEVSTVAHWTLAGGFTWLFARRIGLGRPAAALAALGFMLSGRILSGAYQHFVLTSQVWLPAFLWAVHGLATERRLRWSVALAAVLALSFLGGYVQTFLYAAQLAAAYGVFLWWVACPAGERGRALGAAALAGALALAAVAPQLGATLEFAALASRDLAGLSLAEAGRQAVAPGRLATGLLGALGGGDTGPPQPYPWLVTLPALAVPLAVAAAFNRPLRAQVAFFAVTSILAGAFLLGEATPVFAAYHALPLGDLFRFPIRMDFVYVFCATLLAACGAEAACAAVRRGAGARAAGAVGLALAACVGLELAGRSRLEVTHPVLTPPTRALDPALAARVRESGARVLLPLAPKHGTLEGVFAVPDYEPSLPRAYGRYFAPRDAATWHGSLGRRHELASGRLQPLLDRMSVRFYAAPRNVRPEQLRRLVAGHAATEQPGVAERPAALPRVYAAAGISLEPEPQRARAAMLAGSGRDVVVASEVAAVAAQEAARVTLLRHEPQRVEIEAECPQACLVVLTDLDYPGWRAEIDGEPAPIVTANLLYRAVAVPAGRHRVVHRYRPLGLLRGAALGGALGCGAVALALVLRRRGGIGW